MYSKAHGIPRLVLDPSHAQLVRSHVGTRDVVGKVADRAGESADELLFLLGGHARVGEDHRLAATMRQPGSGILPGHCTGKARKHSSTETSGAMRTPPIAVPQAVLSITTMAFKPPAR